MTVAISRPVPLTMPILVFAPLVAIVGSLLPDLDQASNRLWDLLPGGNFLGRIFKSLLLGHRTLSHSFLGLLLIYQMSFWLLPRVFNSDFINPHVLVLSLMIGVISHIAADGLTEDGVPLLFPLKWRFGFPPIRSWRIKTGRWFENWIIFPLVALYIIYLLVTLTIAKILN
jgi:membrane-bound metal-dependent hydrolase YbcI (DUF457 family)